MDYTNAVLETDPARIKERIEKMQAATGTIGYAPKTPHGLQQECEPVQEGLTERFRSNLRRVNREKRKADRLEELVYLLEKNPEIARILDLVDALGHD